MKGRELGKIGLKKKKAWVRKGNRSSRGGMDLMLDIDLNVTEEKLKNTGRRDGGNEGGGGRVANYKNSIVERRGLANLHALL